jgi:phosphatidylglycerol:prolipoprotein diacylglycerol transferase
MIPTVIQLGPLPIYSFGLLMMCAFVAAHELLVKQFEVFNIEGRHAERMVFWAAIGGIVGARLGYIFTFPDGMGDRVFDTLFSNAGFVFHWGLIGGFLGVTAVLMLAKLSFLKVADLVAPSLSLGYAIGRVGCQLSGDGDYGKVSSLPFAMSFPLGVIPTRWGEFVHPTPVYETLGALVVTTILLTISRWKGCVGTGVVFGGYLVLSGFARYSVEFIRIEPVVYNNLTQAQLVSLYLIAVGAVFTTFGLYRRGKITT